MNSPKLIIVERDGAMAGQVHELAREHRWLVRECRQADACMTILNEAGPAVLLLKAEKDLSGALALLTRAAEACAVCLFCEEKHDNPAQRALIAGMAYDLGATAVIFPPHMPSMVEDLAAGLMAEAIERDA